MQELLARLTALDTSASMSLRVIACFDELVRGGVNVHALLSAGASMAGSVAGFHDERSGRSMRVGPDGVALPDDADASSIERVAHTDDGLTVWIEKSPPLGMNDAMVVERLALGIGLRLGRNPPDGRRGLSSALDPDVPPHVRQQLLVALGLRPNERHRIVCLPLFATWHRHGHMVEDVVNTPFGPIHVAVVPESVIAIEASPCGIGVPMSLDDLDRSFRTAMVCLRLSAPPDVSTVVADDYGGLVELLAASHTAGPLLDVDPLDAIMAHSWGAETLDALVKAGSVRQAARLADVHHSTMQTRIDEIQRTLPFDPMDGIGRTRIGIAYLVWRLQHSTVLVAPPTAEQR